MTFYKVVRSLGKGLVSARINLFVHDETYSRKCILNLQVNYRTQRWVKPRLKKSKIFVFGSLEAATDFALTTEHIYECEVRNPIAAKIMSRTLDNIKDFWINDRVYSHMVKIPPDDTYLCDAIKLIKRVV